MSRCLCGYFINNDIWTFCPMCGNRIARIKTIQKITKSPIKKKCRISESGFKKNRIYKYVRMNDRARIYSYPSGEFVGDVNIQCVRPLKQKCNKCDKEFCNSNCRLYKEIFGNHIHTKSADSRETFNRRNILPLWTKSTGLMVNGKVKSYDK